MSLHVSAHFVLQAATGAVQAQAVMDQHAKSFSWAAKFLAPRARRDAAQLYAFARLADDLADEEQLGSLAQRMAQLARLRHEVLQSGDNGPDYQTSQGCGVGHMLRRHGVDVGAVATFMDCLSQDSGPRCIATQEELLQFAYGVAGTVGQMMCPILGSPVSAQHFAIALGIAMQLTNIARDVLEDAQRGRCYLPQDWGVGLDDVGASANTAQAERTFAAIRRILQLADDFYAVAHNGMALIPKDNRRAIAIAAALYRGIGLKIIRLGPIRYWQRRVSLGRAEKTWIIAKTLAGFVPDYPPAQRDVFRVDLLHLVGVPGFPSLLCAPT